MRKNLVLLALLFASPNLPFPKSLGVAFAQTVSASQPTDACKAQVVTAPAHKKSKWHWLVKSLEIGAEVATYFALLHY
jgi:hypothetical protein